MVLRPKRPWFRVRDGALALVLACAVCLSCGRPLAPSFSTDLPANTAATNAMRKELGLRLIDPEKWFFYGTRTFDDKREEVWKTSRDGYECKKVAYYRTGAILWEEDYYYTGKTFMPGVDPDAGHAHEMLVIHYEYGTRNMEVTYIGQDAAVRTLFGQTRPGDVASSKDVLPLFDVNAQKALADKVLAMWGMTRR